MQVNLINDYIPFQINVTSTQVIVRWVESKDLVFKEPFFKQTLNALFSNGKSPRIVDTSLDYLIEVASCIDTLKKIKGFIFHTSRCGSTLVLNVLRNCKSVYVISESQIFSSVMFPNDSGFWKNHFLDDTLRYKIFNSLEKLFLYFFLKTDKDANVLVKFSSWNIISLDWLVKFVGDTQILIIYRHPIETMVSILRKPIGFYYLRSVLPHLTEYILRMPYESIEQLRQEEYIARMLGVFYGIACRKFVGSDIKRTNYSSLNLNSLIAICEFFAINKTEFMTEQINSQLGSYSKDLTKAFLNDSQIKRETASNEIIDMAQSYCMKAYFELDSFAPKQDYLIEC